MNMNMNESMVEHYADAYVKKYSDQINAFEKYSMLARAGQSINPSDIYALGRQLEQFEDYRSFVESNGSVADLGQIPNIALDVITASYGSSILPLVASTQAIDEEQGIIYFKQIKATSSGYGRTAGDVISNATGGSNYSETYGSYEVAGEVVGQTVAGTTSYSINLVKVPVRPFTVNLNVADTQFRAIDDGKGAILGAGVSGTINYETGVVALTFSADPGAHDVVASYGVNVEAGNDVLGISGSLDSTSIRAEVFSLKAETGLLQEYSFQKRFGRMATDEVAQDLTSELTRVINTAAIKRMDLACKNEVTWKKTAPDGVSYAEHKLTFVDAFANAENMLNSAAGRGNISRMIAGTNAAAILRGMPGFTTVDTALNQSVGLYGYLNGVPVIRASSIIDTDSIVCSYKGGSYFEAPLVHAPYMPLFVSSTIASGNNPLRNQRVAAVWSGLKVVILS